MAKKSITDKQKERVTEMSRAGIPQKIISEETGAIRP